MTMAKKQLASILSKNWWVLLLRGLAAIAFGLLTWSQPGTSLASLLLLFGAYLLTDGVLGIWHAITGRKDHSDWWLLLIWGLLGTGVGLMTFIAPNVIARVLVLYIAIWAITTGLLEIVSAIRLRKVIKGEWLLILSGVVSVAFGSILITQPAQGALALIWLIGTYALIFGVILVLLAFKVRRHNHANLSA